MTVLSTDCLLVGHNQQPLTEVEARVRQMGATSAAYRDLRLSILGSGEHALSLSDLLNRSLQKTTFVPLQFGDVFSAAIGTLGSALDARGFSFDFVNSFQSEKLRLRQLLETRRYLCVGVTTTFYVEPSPLLEVVEFIRSACPSAVIVVGGPFVATHEHSLSAPELAYLLHAIGADVYVGNALGEEVLCNIVARLKRGERLDDVPGLWLRGAEVYFHTGHADVASQAAAHINWRMPSLPNVQFAVARTSLSCPFACGFCSFPERAGRFRTLQLPGVLHELNGLRQKDDVKGILFADDTFNVPIGRFKELLRALLRSEKRLPWFGNIRCQQLDDEAVTLMKESGCNMAFLGLESGSDPVLTSMNKAATVRAYRSAVEMLRQGNIATFGSFVLGYPGETEHTIQETRDFIESVGLDFYRINLWYLERMSPIWRERDRRELRGEHFQWRHPTMDAVSAQGWIEQLLLEIEGPLWVPIYDFDIVAAWQLLCKGMPIERLRAILRIYQQALRQQLRGGIEPASTDFSSLIRSLSESGCSAACTLTAGARAMEAPGAPAHG